MRYHGLFITSICHVECLINKKHKIGICVVMFARWDAWVNTFLFVGVIKQTIVVVDHFNIHWILFSNTSSVHFK